MKLVADYESSPTLPKERLGGACERRNPIPITPLVGPLPYRCYSSVTRPIFLYQSELESLSVNSPIPLISCGSRALQRLSEEALECGPIDVLVFSVTRLWSSANAAGVRSAKALCGRS